MAAKMITDLPTAIALADAHLMEVEQTVSGKITLVLLREFFRKPAVQAVTSSATVTAVAANDMVVITAQAAALTLANPTGTYVQGQRMRYRIKDNGTARAITFGANFRAMGVTLPTTTVVNKTLYLDCVYNSTDTKWDVVAVNQEA